MATPPPMMASRNNENKNKNMNENEIMKPTAGESRPKLAFYHPNARGTGAAAKFALIPATNEREGVIHLEMANQGTIGSRSTFATFDWSENGQADLCFADICKILQVFRGETESIDDGKGTYHRTASGRITRFMLRHVLEPVGGYTIDLYTANEGGEEWQGHIFINHYEALGLCEAITACMGRLCFGD